MKNSSLQWLQFTILFLICYTTITNSLDTKFEDEEVMKIAKRNLLCREKEYLKQQPLSENLRNFIKRIKREARHSKYKRSEDSLESNMYVLRGGNAIPVKQLNIRDVGENRDFTIKDDTVLQSGFTVVPLIVPRQNISGEEDFSCVEQTTTPECIEDPGMKLDSGMNIHKEDNGMNIHKEDNEMNIHKVDTGMNIHKSFLPPSKQSTSTISTTRTTTATRTSTLSTTIKPTKSTPLPIEKVTDEYDNVPIEATTKGELLGKVIKDVKDLIKYEKKSRPQGEASLCNVTGDWDSFAGGMQIRISFGIGNIHTTTPKVCIVPMEPPRDGFMTGNLWNATGIAPFPNASMIALTIISTTTKRMATFLGECRYCEGAESITGHWMLRRRSKTCKDREEANTFFSDVLRKNNVRKLQHEHLEEIVASTLESLDV